MTTEGEAAVRLPRNPKAEPISDDEGQRKAAAPAGAMEAATAQARVRVGRSPLATIGLALLAGFVVAKLIRR